MKNRAYLLLLPLLGACSYSPEVPISSSFTVSTQLSETVKNNVNVEIKNSAALNHKAFALGIFCSANDYNVDLESPIIKTLAPIIASEASKVSLVIDFKKSSTHYNCISESALSMRCFTTTAMEGEFVLSSMNKKTKSSTFKFESKADASGGSCGIPSDNAAKTMANIIVNFSEEIEKNVQSYLN